MEILDIVLIVLLIIILLIISQYNKLVKLRNKVKQSESGMDIYLNQRFDLIPNLVECVKGYSKYESETFEKIVKLRNIYRQTDGVDFDQATELNRDINQLLAIAENYPELKASEQYLNLQKNLTKIENQLQVARRIYNFTVTEYNTKIEVVPSNIIAKMFGFKQARLFEIEEYKRENINLKEEFTNDKE